jgi:hypothetical protein
MFKKLVGCIFLYLCINNCSLYAQQIVDSIKKVKANGVEINKGTMFLGGTIQLNSKKSDNSKFINAQINEKFSRNIDLSMYYGYTIKSNFSMGIGLNYMTKKYEQLITTNTGILINEKYISRSYGFNPLIKNFIPIDKNHRFYLFTQTKLFYEFTQSVTQNDAQGEIVRTIDKIHAFGFAFEPGITAFMVRNFALEVSVPLAGYKSKYKISQVTNMPDEHIYTNSLDFKINVLQFNLGLYGYF